jgi:3-deoxy-7-phosphoheptulonate synthase
MPGVEALVPIMKPYKLAGRELKKDKTIINVNGVIIGGSEIIVIAGPCSVETRDMVIETALYVKNAGAKILRGGAFKPRTSPYSFQGLEEEGLKILSEARDITGLPYITEVMDTRDVELIAEYSDIIQVGARNMQNFRLLKEVGETKKPVMLKRGFASTIEEWLMAAEYIMDGGNHSIILCERGIRTFETATRNTIDLTTIPIIHENSHLPIFIDPSHSTGNWKYVPELCKGAVAMNTDGLMIEVHPDPSNALSDGNQSLRPDKFAELMKLLYPIAQTAGRSITI